MGRDRSYWDGYLGLDLPPGWTSTEDEGVICVSPPDGGGALHLSFARSRGDVAGDLGEASHLFARSVGLNDVGPQPCVVGGFDASTFETETLDTPARYWRVWLAGARGRRALITYTCSAEARDVDRRAVDELVESIEWLW